MIVLQSNMLHPKSKKCNVKSVMNSNDLCNITSVHWKQIKILRPLTHDIPSSRITYKWFPSASVPLLHLIYT